MGDFVVKRVSDLVLSTIAIIALSPILLMIAALVRFKLGPPVIFAQDRSGLHGRPFRMYKFRSMRPLEPGEVPGPASDAARLGRFGRWLRSTSLDELPELWNVLRGDMSLVGPRPLLIEYLPLYSARQARRHEVRPGITGLAQVMGRNGLDWDRRLELDVQYVERRSLWLDLKILGATIVTVFRREGIAQPGRETMERFSGPR